VVRMECESAEQQAPPQAVHVRTIRPIPLAEFAHLEPVTSKIQNGKRNAIRGLPSRWPDEMEPEFAELAAAAKRNPYVKLDLSYLRNRAPGNRAFAYVVSYDTFVFPSRDADGNPNGKPVLRSVVKLGDGGREQGRSAGQASGSIISRVVRSYWNEGNAYRSVLQGVAIPGDDSAVSLKVARKIGSSSLR